MQRQKWDFSDMSVVKKIIHNTFETLKEGVVDSAKQIGETVSPKAILEQVLNSPPKKDEFSQFLMQGGGSDLSPAELEKKKLEYASSDSSQLEEARRALSSNPDHMRMPQKQKEPTPYEKTVEDQERKKAQAIEAQKRQSQQMAPPTSKQARGMLGGKKKSANKGFEGFSKDSKTG
jgi:hypothetical protein